MWRVLGCFDVYQVRRPVVPYNESIVWDTAIDSMPAWLMSISGPDLDQDGDVTVTFDRSLNVLLRDTHGGVLSGATFAIDPDPRSHSVFAGTIKDGIRSIHDIFGESIQVDDGVVDPGVRENGLLALGARKLTLSAAALERL